MKRVLIVDTETTGLDPVADCVIEVAAILYSVEHATTLCSWSSVVFSPSNAAEHVNRIPAAACTESKVLAPVAWEFVCEMAESADVFVAHRAEFDHGFASPRAQSLRPWVCSKFDIEWPRQDKPGASLVQLALAHDLGVAYAHRAMADCDLIARLFTRSRELGADLDAMLTRAMRPKKMLAACVSYDDRELAKQAGFQWDGTARSWRRKMVPEDAVGLPFKTVEVTT